MSDNDSISEEDFETQPESLCSLFSARWKIDNARAIVSFLIVLTSLVSVGSSHSAHLFRLEKALPSSSCYNIGWLRMTDCSSSKTQFLLAINDGLGAAGLAVGVSHFVQGLVMSILAASFLSFNPRKPIKCFQAIALSAQVVTLILVGTADAVFFVSANSLTQTSVDFFKFTHSWGSYLCYAGLFLNLCVVLMGVYVYSYVVKLGGKFFVPMEGSDSPRALSEVELGKFTYIVHTLSPSMSAPTHRRNSSTFSAILGLNSRTVTPREMIAHVFGKHTRDRSGSVEVREEAGEIELEKLAVSETTSTITNSATPSHSAQAPLCPIETWTVENVSEWMEKKIGDLSAAEIALNQKIDGHRLWRMDDADFVDAGFEEIEQRHSIMNALDELLTRPRTDAIRMEQASFLSLGER